MKVSWGLFLFRLDRRFGLRLDVGRRAGTRYFSERAASRYSRLNKHAEHISASRANARLLAVWWFERGGVT